MKINTLQVNIKLPERLKRLRDLAMNMWFSWDQEALDIFIRLGYHPACAPERNFWDESGQNPMKLLSILPQSELDDASQDDSFVSNLERVYEKLQSYLNSRSWFQKTWPDRAGFLAAYFSCEYGLDECLPVYSGGLGILSGDHLKAASDLGLPLVGIGLLYQEGYFQQYLNNDGWQQELYPDNDWYTLPVTCILNSDGLPLIIDVPMGEEPVFCQIWRVDVGRIPLYLLDTNIAQNQPYHREITKRLYGGDRDMRIRQEIVLGIGGVRALAAMDIHPTVFHINEGHSAFLSFERIRMLKQSLNLTHQQAWEIVWGSNVFTTHTPVPAGNENFTLDLIRKYFTKLADELGYGIDQFIHIGQEKPDRSSFCLTVLALRMAAQCNGVAKLHGETSRKMWQMLWPELPVEEVPISHVTNGVHSFTWINNRLTDLLESYFGPKFREEPEDPEIWDRIEYIPDNELWRIHQLRRDRLISFTRGRLSRQLRHRGYSRNEVAKAEEVLNPDFFTIGFSRRFATYKRATLLFHDLNRLEALLKHPERPVQIIFAGKAHPQDNPGKDLIKRIVKVSDDPAFRNHIVFLENYDINVARYLLHGSDVWLNTPRRPLEASGTSGMKAALNGVLNLSILDGWWVEGYGEDNGWAIGSGETYDDPLMQDAIESEALYRLLEREITETFYNRDRSGLPRQWIRMMKDAMKSAGKNFTTHRMVMDYARFYIQGHDAYEKIVADDGKLAREVNAWRDRILESWNQVHVIETRIRNPLKDVNVGDRIDLDVRVQLGNLTPDDIVVQVYFGSLDHDDQITGGRVETMRVVKQKEADWLYEGSFTVERSGRCGYATRILPHHSALIHPFTPLRIKWE
ncbi:alpha-glucan family phosphorylase [bacterium]|nr:alpha-glucan family phosphorylase [candidate division CSSED10-310 bacterium]